jgi:hypothetical protein
MDRHYLVNDKPVLVPFMDLVNKMTENDVLKCSELGLIRIARLELYASTNVDEYKIVRVI